MEESADPAAHHPLVEPSPGHHLLGGSVDLLRWLGSHSYQLQCMPRFLPLFSEPLRFLSSPAASTESEQGDAPSYLLLLLLLLLLDCRLVICLGSFRSTTSHD